MRFRHSIVYTASEDRLQTLIAERLKDGADQDTIDRRIRDLFGETWCVMATDLIGFSRGVEEFGIIHFLQMMFEAERILVPILERHDGILLKVEGDTFLVIFRNPLKALQASVEMQHELRRYNQGRAAADQVLLGIGLGYGEMLRIGDADVFGREVNSAYILGEDTAGAYEVLMTGAVRAALGETALLFEQIDCKKPCAGGAFRAHYQPE